jgi:lysophospholipase L1-like esterase
MKKTISLILLIIHSAIQAQQLKISEPVRFLALGDSYTAGTSVDINQSWPYQLFNRLSAEGLRTERLEILARPGWTTSNLTKAIRDENLKSDYTLVSLLIGVNNQYKEIPFEQYEPSFEDLLKKAIELAGGNRSSVFVLSIPDYAFTPFGKGDILISSEIAKYNNINRTVAQRNNITYFDLTQVTQLGLENPELIAVDGLHPSSLMYEIWVDMVLQHIRFFTQQSTSAKRTTLGPVLILYPNPAYDYLTVRFDQEEDIK